MTSMLLWSCARCVVIASGLSTTMHPLLQRLDPRRSLAAAIGWLIFALSAGLVLAASVWVGDIVVANLLDMRGRQLDRAADDFADELNLSFALRLQSVRALASMLATEIGPGNQAELRKILANLQRASPEFERIVVADARGRILASANGEVEGSSVAERSWFVLGLSGSRIGDVRVVPMTVAASPGPADIPPGSALVLVAPVVDTNGLTAGVIGIHLSGRWLRDLAASSEDKLRIGTGTQALVLDAQGAVLTGAANFRGERFASIVQSTDAATLKMGVNASKPLTEEPAHVERIGDDSGFLVARVMPEPSDPLHALGWRIVVLEPLQTARRHAGALQAQIAAVLIGLGLLATLFGVFTARRVTRDLEAIARSADAVRAGTTQQIAVPRGRREAARLGHALDELLASLQRERSALQALNAELDQRVAARTREVERLAAQARYAAVVRERLKIARDLHDTLAHSMMAMLAEIRLLKRLAATDPSAVMDELAHAEEAAHQGLKEARAAIAQMRFNAVRDAGFAAAMADFAKAFAERTGIAVDFTTDAQPGTFADESAETLFRIAEEAMRNVERHSGATRLAISLTIAPEGRGFKFTIADNGIGFDANASYPGHYGLVGLREQAQLIGAAFTIHSTAQQGTTITVAREPEQD